MPLFPDPRVLLANHPRTDRNFRKRLLQDRLHTAWINVGGNRHLPGDLDTVPAQRDQEEHQHDRDLNELRQMDSNLRSDFKRSIIMTHVCFYVKVVIDDCFIQILGIVCVWTYNKIKLKCSEKNP